MIYNEHELKIFRDIINDYNTLKKEIDKRVENGYTIDSLFDYIRHLSACSINSYELDSEDFKYIDFYYGDMTCSIVQENNKAYLGRSVEVWDDKNDAFLGSFYIEEIEYIINKGGKE